MSDKLKILHPGSAANYIMRPGNSLDVPSTMQQRCSSVADRTAPTICRSEEVPFLVCGWDALPFSESSPMIDPMED
jgi:hypothetical protein